MSSTDSKRKLRVSKAKDLPKYNLVADIFPIGGVTLVVGKVGTGKTYSTMKAVIEDGYVPYWFNLDAVRPRGEFKDSDYKMCLYAEDLYGLLTGTVQVPSDMRVLVIDTYSRISEGGLDSDESATITKAMEELARLGIAVIVIGHPENYQSTSTLTFKENPYLLGACSEYCELIKREGTLKRDVEYNLNVVKGRGGKGPRTVTNWVRHKGINRREKREQIREIANEDDQEEINDEE